MGAAWALFLTALASDENLATRFLLQTFLVETTGSDEEADVVDAGVDRDVDFLPDLVVFLVFATGYFWVVVYLGELDAEGEIFLFQHYKWLHDVYLLTLLSDFSFICISPPIDPFPAVLRLPWNVDVLLVSSSLVPIYFWNKALRS